MNGFRRDYYNVLNDKMHRASKRAHPRLPWYDALDFASTWNGNGCRRRGRAVCRDVIRLERLKLLINSLT